MLLWSIQSPFDIRGSIKHYGYKIFDQLYKNLIRMMDDLRGVIALDNESQIRIEDKLIKFKQSEEKLRAEIIRLIEQNRLYRASRGFVDSHKLDDDEMRMILEKHSNLLDLSQVYNRKAVNLVYIFQTVINVVLDKIHK